MTNATTSNLPGSYAPSSAPNTGDSALPHSAVAAELFQTTVSVTLGDLE